MFGLNFPELLIIALAAGVLLFGSKKIVDIAHSLGRFSGEFQKGKQDIERELNIGRLEVTRDSFSENSEVASDSLNQKK